MKKGPHLIYTLRPDNTALWLPSDLMEALGIKRGDRLTQAQFNDPRVQELLAERRTKQ